jgi:SAM-dependent methyltransferase
MTHDHAHDVRERRFTEGDREAWEREVDPHELFDPAKRDIYNFIDETKVAHLRPLLPPAGRAIEIGAGSGRLLVRTGLERPYRLIALDYAAYAMRAVRENARRAKRDVDLALGDARALPFADASFDVVLSGGLLEHFRDPRPLLAETARVLASGGRVVVDVPQTFHLYTVMKQALIAMNRWFAGWETQFTPGELERLIRETGLSVRRTYGEWMVPGLGYRIVRELLKRRTPIVLPLEPRGPRFWSAGWDALRRRFARTRASLYTSHVIGTVAEKPGVNEAARP